MSESFNKQCSCCGVAETEDVEIELVHETSGERKTHVMKKICACGCAATKCAATEEQLEKIEEDVIAEIQNTGAELKAELKEELGKETFDQVRDSVKEDVRGLKSRVAELFGF